MKILVVCEQGNNRSVTVAHHLKYWGHDVIPAGLATNSAATIQMLADWADRIILTDYKQRLESTKTQVWDIGPDVYPRPFNRDLLSVVRRLMEEHKQEYK